MLPPPIVHRSTFSPTMPKNTGASTENTNDSSRCTGLALHVRHLPEHRAGDERAEHRVDADVLGRGRAQERHDQEQHQVRVRAS